MHSDYNYGGRAKRHRGVRLPFVRQSRGSGGKERFWISSASRHFPRKRRHASYWRSASREGGPVACHHAFTTVKAMGIFSEIVAHIGQ
jgi:hypothetical protein